MNQNTRRGRVEMILKYYPNSRNTDKNLWTFYLMKYWSDELMDEWFVKLWSDLKRIRCDFQSKGLYPAIKEVQELRIDAQRTECDKYTKRSFFQKMLDKIKK